MSIAFSCPKCDAAMKVRDDLAGRRLRCANCGAATTAPDLEDVDDFGESGDRGRSRRGERRSLRRTDSGVAAFYKILIGSGVAVFLFTIFVIVVMLVSPGNRENVVAQAAPAVQAPAVQQAPVAQPAFPGRFAPPGPGPRRAAIRAPIVNGKFEANGIINVADNVPDRAGWLGMVYEVELKKDRSYQTDLMSNQLDAYLFLCSANGNDVLAFDDDSGGNLNARIVYTPTVTGKYRIIATSVTRNQIGAFTFRVAETGRLEDRKPAAVASLVGGKYTVNDAIGLGDLVPNIPNQPRCLGKEYDVELRNDRRYQIDVMSTEFDSFVYLLDAQGRVLALDDDSGENRNARLFYLPAQSAKYRIVASSFLQGSTGRFTLQITELPRAGGQPVPQVPVRPPQPTFPDPRNPATPATLVGGVFEAKDRIDLSDKLRTVGSLIGKAYEINLTANRTYRIDLELVPDDAKSTLSTTPKIVVESARPNQPLIARSNPVAKGEKTTQLTYVPATTGPVRIVASSLNSRATGTFTLRIREEK